MKVNIDKKFEEVSNLFTKIINKLGGEPNSWYNVSVGFELDENERIMYENFLKDKENKGYDKSILVNLPMWGKDKRMNGWSVDSIVNPKAKYKCVCFANDNIELLDIEDAVKKEAVAFKEMLLNFTTVKNYNSENKSGNSSIEI